MAPLLLMAEDPRRGVRTRRVRGLALMLLLAVSVPSMAVGQETTDGVAVSVVVRGSPIPSGGAGRADAASITLDLDLPAHVRLQIVDFDGRTVRELMDGPRDVGTYKRRWNGRDDAGKPVPEGPYRVVATADVGERVDRAEAWITVADREVYPLRPAFITVVLDPGHGGSHAGALGPDGTREADLNLDIALRAAAMLEGEGVNVVLTRISDSNVNTPALDRTSDGVADDTDELAARTDIANAARGDLYISVHNNFAVDPDTGGPSTFFSDERTFSGRSARLARLIQAEMVATLGAFASNGWKPFDHGALTYPYYVLRDYDPPRLRRPTQMPAVLSEGMFLSNPRELRLLQRPRRAPGDGRRLPRCHRQVPRPAHKPHRLRARLRALTGRSRGDGHVRGRGPQPGQRHDAAMDADRRRRPCALQSRRGRSSGNDRGRDADPASRAWGADDGDGRDHGP